MAATTTSIAVADEAAFVRLVAPHRAALLAHCYRMLGSVQDAEDALQEALVRAWRGLPAFQGRSALRSWLYRIATNVCLRAIERRPPPPAAEVPWLEPLADVAVALPDGRASPAARYEEREAVELAFVAALQHLPGRQRAVLLLRDVLGFAPAEIAVTLDTTPAAVSSALQRARRATQDGLTARSQQTTLRGLGDRRLAGLVERYVEAWEQGDVAGLVALLAADATFVMPPDPRWFRGHAAIADFVSTGPLARPGRWRLVPTAANGQPAFAVYRRDGGGASTAHAYGVTVIAVDGAGRVTGIVAFNTPELVARFGLPVLWAD